MSKTQLVDAVQSRDAGSKRMSSSVPAQRPEVISLAATELSAVVGQVRPGSNQFDPIAGLVARSVELRLETDKKAGGNEQAVSLNEVKAVVLDLSKSAVAKTGEEVLMARAVELCQGPEKLEVATSVIQYRMLAHQARGVILSKAPGSDGTLQDLALKTLPSPKLACLAAQMLSRENLRQENPERFKARRRRMAERLEADRERMAQKLGARLARRTREEDSTALKMARLTVRQKVAEPKVLQRLEQINRQARQIVQSVRENVAVSLTKILLPAVLHELGNKTTVSDEKQLEKAPKVEASRVDSRPDLLSGLSREKASVPAKAAALEATATSINFNLMGYEGNSKAVTLIREMSQILCELASARREERSEDKKKQTQDMEVRVEKRRLAVEMLKFVLDPAVYGPELQAALDKYLKSELFESLPTEASIKEMADGRLRMAA